MAVGVVRFGAMRLPHDSTTGSALPGAGKGPLTAPPHARRICDAWCAALSDTLGHFSLHLYLFIQAQVTIAIVLCLCPRVDLL